MINYRRYYLLIDWPHWARAALTIIIAVIVAVLMLLFLPDATGESVIGQDEPITKYEAHILELEKQAADEALRNQIMHLYLTWLKDEGGQPQRAVKGARQARSAYIRVMQAIERRQEQLPK